MSRRMSEKRKYLAVRDYKRFDHYDGVRRMPKFMIDLDFEDDEIMLVFNEIDRLRLLRLYSLSVRHGNRIPYYDGGQYVRQKTRFSQKKVENLIDFDEFFVVSERPNSRKNKNVSSEASGQLPTSKEQTKEVTNSKNITLSLNSVGTNGSGAIMVSEKEGIQPPVEPTSEYLKSIRMKRKWSQEEWNMAAEYVGKFFMRCRCNPEWEQQNGFDNFAKMISRETLSVKQLRRALEKAFTENIATIPARWHLPSKTELEAQHGSK